MNGIVWTCCWFVTVSLCEWLDAKSRAMQGREPQTENERTAAGFVCLLIWVGGLICVL